METIYLLLLAFLACWYFLYLRKIAEQGKRLAEQYCKQENLQIITVSRRSSRLNFNKKAGIHWLSCFDFEFSGDGESKYQGELILVGLMLKNVEVPPYRIH